MDLNFSSAQQTIEVIDVFGKKIRTTSQYWSYIIAVKHKEARDKLKLDDVWQCIRNPDQVRQSQNPAVVYYYKSHQNQSICVVVRHLNSEGFIITSYLTSKSKRKGKQIWPTKLKFILIQ